MDQPGNTQRTTEMTEMYNKIIIKKKKMKKKKTKRLKEMLENIYKHRALCAVKYGCNNDE